MSFEDIPTKRLLSLYQGLRKYLYLSHHSSLGLTDEEYDLIEQDHKKLEEMKAELDTREHIPRERHPPRKQKRILKYRRV